MPLGGSQSLSKTLSVFTLINDITFTVGCLRMASRGVLEKGSKSRW